MKRVYHNNSNKSGVYVIYCTKKFGVYIGSTNIFKRRCSSHLNLLEKNKHHAKHLQNAWNKYGKDNFVFEVIKVISIEKMRKREQEFLDIHFDKNYCYNSLPYARDTNLFVSNEKTKELFKKIYSRKKSEEEKRKISESRKNMTKIAWKNRKYVDPRIIYAIDTLLEKELFPRGVDFSTNEIEYITEQAILAYNSFPYYCKNNPSLTAKRMQMKKDFKYWCEIQKIWIDKRKNTWHRMSKEEKNKSLLSLRKEKQFKEY